MTDKAPSALHAFAIDLRALAAFRVALALLADVATRLADWRVFFTDDGPRPPSAHARMTRARAHCD